LASFFNGGTRGGGLDFLHLYLNLFWMCLKWITNEAHLNSSAVWPLTKPLTRPDSPYIPTDSFSSILASFLNCWTRGVIDFLHLFLIFLDVFDMNHWRSRLPQFLRWTSFDKAAYASGLTKYPHRIILYNTGVLFEWRHLFCYFLFDVLFLFSLIFISSTIIFFHKSFSW